MLQVLFFFIVSWICYNTTSFDDGGDNECFCLCQTQSEALKFVFTVLNINRFQWEAPCRNPVYLAVFSVSCGIVLVPLTLAFTLQDSHATYSFSASFYDVD